MRLFARRDLDICHCVIIQYESDTAHIRYKLLQSFYWELLHHPPCCSDPAPSDHYYRCGLLKRRLGCHMYHSSVKVDMVVFEWL